MLSGGFFGSEYRPIMRWYFSIPFPESLERAANLVSEIQVFTFRGAVGSVNAPILLYSYLMPYHLQIPSRSLKLIHAIFYPRDPIFHSLARIPQIFDINRTSRESLIKGATNPREGPKLCFCLPCRSNGIFPLQISHISHLELWTDRTWSYKRGTSDSDKFQF